MHVYSIYFCAAVILAIPAVGAEDWTSLFDGKSLAGWKVEGNGDWKVQEGAIVGRQGENFSGGDMYTDRQWGDFELEAEYKLSYPGNSGIWFHHAPPQVGYHVDLIDEPQHADAFAGSLYVVKKGFVAKNSDPKSFRRNDWNRVRIRSIGDDITIVLNGKTVVHLKDATFPLPGAIGLQVHRGEAAKGMEVRYRKMRIRELGRK
jgi:hypothetical protein